MYNVHVWKVKNVSRSAENPPWLQRGGLNSTFPLLFLLSAGKAFSWSLWGIGRKRQPFSQVLGFFLESRHVNQMPLWMNLEKAPVHIVSAVCIHFNFQLESENEIIRDHRSEKSSHLSQTVKETFHTTGRPFHLPIIRRKGQTGCKPPNPARREQSC